MVYECIFTDFNNFGEYEDLPYVDSLAFMVMKFLYTNKVSDNVLKMQLEGIIELYDFMSIVVPFIHSSTSDFGEAEIKKYLREMDEVTESMDLLSSNIVRYRYGYADIRYVYINHASWEMKLALLWTGYIYASVMSKIDNPDNWNDAIMILKSLMAQVCFDYENIPVMQYKDEAIQLMTGYIKKKYGDQEEKPKSKENEGDDKGLTREQCALFTHALATYEPMNFTWTNKKEDLAPIASKLFGRGQRSMANRMTEGYTNDDRKIVADIFRDVCPEFASHIETFEKKGANIQDTPSA